MRLPPGYKGAGVPPSPYCCPVEITFSNRFIIAGYSIGRGPLMGMEVVRLQKVSWETGSKCSPTSRVFKHCRFRAAPLAVKLVPDPAPPERWVFRRTRAARSELLYHHRRGRQFRHPVICFWSDYALLPDFPAFLQSMISGYLKIPFPRGLWICPTVAAGFQ